MVDCSTEIWKPVMMYGGIFKDLYQVSNKGGVRSLTHLKEVSRPARISKSGKVSGGDRTYVEVEGKILTPELTDNGYYRVTLIADDGTKKKPKVHQLVAAEFLECPGPCTVKYEIDHIDGDRLNNRADNLRWVTHAENCRYARERNGNYQAKAPSKCPVICLDTGKTYESLAEAARWAANDETVTSKGLIGAIAHKRAYYGHVFVRVSDVTSIKDLNAYKEKLQTDYRNNTPCEDKAIMGKKKKNWKGSTKSTSKLFASIT